VLYFFLSYAHGDDDRYVQQFFADLSAEIRTMAGLRRDDEVGYLDIESIEAGSDWSAAIRHALGTCRTLVALTSPRYFASRRYRQEWGYFEDRQRATAEATGQRPQALFPVVWAPTHLPEWAASLQFARPAKDGLRQALRLKGLRDDYLLFVTQLAQQVVEAARTPVLPGVAHPGYDPADLPSLDPAGTRPGENPVSVVRKVFAAAGRPLRPTAVDGLLTPGPVWVLGRQAPSRALLADFEQGIGTQAAYVLYDGDLAETTATALDQIRLRGKPVVQVPMRVLRAAVADDRATHLLTELEGNYGNRDNLFDTKNALRDERFLFGRDALLNTIGSAIGRDEHVLVTGLRKVGKTSLLNVLRQHLVDQPVCFVDLQRFDRHGEDWPRTLYLLMVEAFDRWGRAEHEPWPFAPEAPETATELERALDRRTAHLGTPTRLVVMLDEIERVFPGPGEAVSAQRWIRASGALRLLAQGEPRRVVVVGADLRPTANRENDLTAGTNPFFSFFQEVPVTLLDQEATADMVRTIGAETGLNQVDRSFMATVFDWSGGHPSLARTLAAAAYRRRRDVSALTGPDLFRGREGLEDTDAIGYFLRNNLWRPMTAAEQYVMRELVTGTGGQTTPHRADRRIAEAALRAQGLLEDGRPRVGLFAEWLRDEYGIPA
jgi:hypothetical protein